MARDEITIQLPTITNTTGAAIKELTLQAVTVANGIKLKKAMECMRNTLMLLVTNSAGADKTVTLKAGNKYPNACLGDLTLPIGTGKTATIVVQDPSRFVDADGAICIDFGTGFTGTIAAVAKPTGIGQ